MYAFVIKTSTVLILSKSQNKTALKESCYHLRGVLSWSSSVFLCASSSSARTAV